MSNTIARGRRPRFPFPVAAAVLSLLVIVIALVASAGGAAEVQAQANGCDGPSVENPTINSDSRTPAARTSYKVSFTTACALVPFRDSIVMVLHEDIGVPRGINPAQVQVRYSGGTQDGLPPDGRGIASAVELEEQDDPRRPTTLTIYPVIRGTGPDASPQSIPENAEVTVTFRREAGITNPTEGGAFSWKVGIDEENLVEASHPGRSPDDDEGDKEVLEAFKDAALADDQSVDAEGYPYGLLVDWEIQLSHEKVGRGEEVTVIGRGYKNGTTLTFWRDANFDGVRDTGEGQLCQANVEGNDIGYCTFIVHKPPFVQKFGECETDPMVRAAAENADCNFINGADGRNHTSIWVRDEDELNSEGAFALDDLPQVLELTVGVIADVGADRRLSVQLRDFPEGELVAAYIGGVPIDLESVSEKTLHRSGSLHFTVDLPGTARRGYQSLRVVVRHGSDNGVADCIEAFNDEVCSEGTTVVWVEPGAVLRVFPEEVLPNQRINLDGKGFILEDGSGEIASVSIGGHIVNPDRVNDGEAELLATDRNGNWAGHVDLPINSATTTPGAREIQVTDIHGRKGLVEVTIPPREVEAVPIWGRPGTIVTVEGRGFPARNDSRSSVNVRIYYDTENGHAVTSAEPDAAGNFSREIRIPLNTPAPSSNTIRAEFDDDNGTTIVTTTRHEIAGATVQVSPAAGPPGTAVSLTGQGFRKFTKVNSVMIGELNVTPGGTVATDANGDFSLTFLAPGAGVGRQTVLVTIAGVTASAPFDISLSGVSAATPVPVVEALADLGDTLVRTFHFNNDTKAWTFYDPELTEANNTQRFMIPGETYLILVRETVTAILNSRQRTLTCLLGNCWNQVVW